MMLSEQRKNQILKDCDARAAYIRGAIAAAGAKGAVFGNSGGKDCALVGILCKRAGVETLGIMMPAAGLRNYGEDKSHAAIVANKFGIENINVDLKETRDALMAAASEVQPLEGDAVTNIAPRLRMTVLYAVGRMRNLLVAGTGNRSERYMGYFTKWGDGACDFSPIADLTVTEVFEYLRALDAPAEIINKAPSAALYEGQTDEGEMGVTYAAIDKYILTGEASEKDKAVIDKAHRVTQHKRDKINVFKSVD